MNSFQVRVVPAVLQHHQCGRQTPPKTSPSSAPAVRRARSDHELGSAGASASSAQSPSSSASFGSGGGGGRGGGGGGGGGGGSNYERLWEAGREAKVNTAAAVAETCFAN